MAGYHEQNQEVITAAKQCLEKHGIVAVSGFDVEGANFRENINGCLSWICSEATGVLFLDGWISSSGCRVELSLAQYLGLRIYIQDGKKIERMINSIKSKY